jgi:hypothetical protein
MAKVHNIGKQHFVQFFRLPAKWGWKLAVRGDTQEIEYPFRWSKPLMLRLPFYYTLVIGKWSGQREDEETALNIAIQGRVLKDEDFQEGWTPPAVKAGEASFEFWDV